MQVPQTEITIRGTDGAVLLQKTVPPGDYVLGRESAVELCFQADQVSRRHAQLTIEYDQAFIQDLGSSNGTFVNGQPVTQVTRLWPNQQIQVGGATVEVRRLRVPAAPDVSLAPSQAAMQRLLPEELLRDRKYAIGKVVAQGGMGAILDARDAATERSVAMKVMLDGSSPDDLSRFVAEARVTAQLEHPNIVPVHELSVDENGQPFYTMKMVRGITLKKVLDLLAEGTEATVRKYPLSTLLTVYQKLCDAVAFAHSKSVIHRDLKPENVMLGDFGEVLVMDWGLAKALLKHPTSNAQHPTPNEPLRGTLSSTAASATLTGTIMGTPQYMSPEQARGEVEDLDNRSDIYALGTIFYHVLALRPPVAGRNAMEVVSKVAEGRVEPLVAALSERRTSPEQRAESATFARKDADARRAPLQHLPGGNIPDSLAAVVHKAMAFERDQRYWSVEELQADLTAYQNGFATSAENASAGRQLFLALKRHKAVAAGVMAVFVVGATFGTKAFLEGHRAEREAIRANQALADLKKSAPALLKLGETEADSQRFPDALRDLDAALALDPALARARWQRAWVLLALERWSDAGAALRLAQQHDPASAKLASILPAVENVAASSEVERWKSDAAREVFQYLQSVEANGAALVFGSKLKLNAQERRKLAEPRLLAAFGKGNYSFYVGSDGLLKVGFNGKSIRSLEPVRGLLIDSLDAYETLITDLEPLRGLRLQSLVVDFAKVANLAPLSGMPLHVLSLNMTQAADLTPLAGLPLTDLNIGNTPVSRIDALRGMPLTKLSAGHTSIVDWSPLKGARLEELNIGTTSVRDLSFLEGMPLRSLNVGNGPIRNLAPLRGLPLETLDLSGTPITDLTPLEGAPLKELRISRCTGLTDFTPVLKLPHLERLRCDVLPKELLPLRESKTLQTIEADAYPGEGFQGARPVAEFWRAYDAPHPAGK